MRIVVTGGTGFLGGYLVQQLLGNGLRPRVLARRSSRADRLEQAGARLVRGDLADEAAVARVLENADIVFHCAAQVSPSAPWEAFRESTVRGTESLFRASLRAGVSRIVYLSSLAVFGKPGGGEAITEESAHDPQPALRGHYSHAKILAERFVLDFCRKSRLPVAIVRPGIIFGRQRNPPAGLLAFGGDRFSLVVGGRNTLFPLIYVENLVDALLLAMGRNSGEIDQFNLVDDPNLTQGDFLRLRRELLPGRVISLPAWPFVLASPAAETLAGVLPIGRLATFSRHQLQRAFASVRYDTGRAHRELGWQPHVRLAEALRRTYCVRDRERGQNRPSRLPAEQPAPESTSHVAAS